MKKIFYILCSTVVLSSCGGSDTSNTSEKELELREKELELKERELALQQAEGNSPIDVSTVDNTTRNTTTRKNTSNNNYSSSSSRPREKTTEELREELYRKEISNPKEYLSVTYDLTYKVLSGEDKITGQIYNYASMATFKDVVLTVSFSTATGTSLGSKDYVVYDYVYSGSSTPFLIKTYSPDGTKQIGVKIKSAKGE